MSPSATDQGMRRSETPTRAALVDDTRAADQLVAALRRAGLPDSRITIISDTEEVRAHFPHVNARPSAGNRTVGAVIAGAIAGILIGLGGAALAGVLQSGDRAQLLIGALIPFTLAVVGGFLGAMMTRGGELESANFHDQEALPGQILVAVELEADDPVDWLARGQEAFRELGARSVALPRG